MIYNCFKSLFSILIYYIFLVIAVMAEIIYLFIFILW